ncbi:hypothetical protein L486_03111 [Kwoniella mangroviensis CBS 10435]|uniref:Ribonuclease H1 N-terminal domain-containing protein n=1 Tax=Kwoniella mangroviensis CBS 10435 TaxID=1331196 RepID=A0A1B9ISV2_9TREE|nr:uncharacterized protein I203_01796 [Kwoniella mangroviensis CBS 8507]OCF58622.1 hypothetical protein L486_03111 [Kwoniella mangroviensis CBS 10435]OCF68414.1 hypothetical protein I203_01796 [Kwoniella mangroviensis CBS 8507]
MATTAMITSNPSTSIDNLDDPTPPGAYIFSSPSANQQEPLSLTSETAINIDTPFQQPSFSLSTQLDLLPTQSVTSYTVSSSIYRVSRLPPQPTIPHAGPSRHPQRYLFFAVRRGRQAGVYTVWHEVERQIEDYPDPVFRTFSTKLAAEAFVRGWDGAGRHSLPQSTPRPLREHLAMSFPGSVNISTSPGKRQSYHSRLLTAPGPSSNDFAPSPLDTTRPPLNPRHSYHRHSMVKVSSPLRCQVDEEEELIESAGSRLPPLRKAASFIGAGGLLSPPQSPEKAQGKNLSIMERERPTRSRSGEGAPWSSRNHRDFSSGPDGGLGLVARPLSPPQSPSDKRATIHGGSVSRPAATRTPSGLWADAMVPRPSPSSSKTGSAGQPEFSDPTAPKFSRSGLKKNGVIMPVAAPPGAQRKNSSQSLRSKASSGSLRGNGFASNNSSSSSIVSFDRRRSSASSSSLGPGHGYAQDRLASLAETSKMELQLSEDGLLSLSPPRPAFMMRRSPSASSVASNESISSMGSMTSSSSTNQTSSLDPCEPILEEDQDDGHIQIVGEERDLVISCTKSDGDADGSSNGDKDSMKGGRKSKSGGGMFKRLAKALKLEKKQSARRGSL